jgi:DNA modification methylase
VYKSTTDLKNKIIELTENIEREPFSWQEQAIAIKELHEMLTEKNKGVWSEVKTSQELGAFQKSHVNMNIQLAEAIETVPDIFEGCSSLRQGIKALKKFKLDEAYAEIALRRDRTNYGIIAKDHVFHGEDIEIMQKLPDHSIHALISDPIYGVGIFDQRFVNRDNAPSTELPEFEDSSEYFMEHMPKMLNEANRILKEDSVILLFCAFQHAMDLQGWMRDIGYRVDPLPAIWARSANTSRTSQPSLYFNRCYEMMVYGTRGNATLIKAGTTNVLNYAGIMSMAREHVNQKPSALMEDIISRFCIPGHVVLDPQCGSGQTLTAAIKRGCIAYGIEKNQHNYSISLSNYANAVKLKDSGSADLIN